MKCQRCKVSEATKDYLDGSPKCSREGCNCKQGYMVCENCLSILDSEFEEEYR